MCTINLFPRVLLISACFLLNTFFHTYAIADDIVKMDRIIAIVDKDVITEQELANKVRTVSNQLEKQGKQLPSEQVLRKQILERLIVDNLQLQLAQQRGISVNDSQLDKTIDRIAEQNKMNLEEFKAALENDGINFYQFREDMRDEITIA
ncbi:MAG TPA: SurA N-terminal domain-containing protein, partial [Methylophilaceae bacterium]|nr:SurA N-terminal domain-containing protein [Methylophilaceae bacterium]